MPRYAVNAKYRVVGSIAYVGAARANFVFAADKDDPSGRRVLFLPNGCNLGPEPPVLAYRIEDRGDGPTVEWAAEPVAVKVEDALAASSEDAQDREERVAADEWLRGTLAGGPVEQPKIVAAGKDAGFGVSALNRSKRRIKAKTLRDGFGPGSKCSWALPGMTTEDDRSAGSGAPIDSAGSP